MTPRARRTVGRIRNGEGLSAHNLLAALEHYHIPHDAGRLSRLRFIVYPWRYIFYDPQLTAEDERYVKELADAVYKAANAAGVKVFGYDRAAGAGEGA